MWESLKHVHEYEYEFENVHVHMNVNVYEGEHALAYEYGHVHEKEEVAFAAANGRHDARKDVSEDYDMDHMNAESEVYVHWIQVRLWPERGSENENDNWMEEDHV